MSATLIPPQYTRPYGLAEVHAVLFQHRNDRGGMSNTIAVMIPEAESHIEAAMAQARALQARVLLVCDTAAQAEAMRSRSQQLLPDHRQVALDRAEAGAWRLDS